MVCREREIEGMFSNQRYVKNTTAERLTGIELVRALALFKSCSFAEGLLMYEASSGETGQAFGKGSKVCGTCSSVTIHFRSEAAGNFLPSNFFSNALATNSAEKSSGFDSSPPVDSSDLTEVRWMMPVSLDCFCCCGLIETFSQL